MAEPQKTLFAELRRQEIVAIIQKAGKVTVEDLSNQFSVSPATIRNDLTELEQRGLLRRTHGGAISRNFAGYELTNQEKAVRNVEQKKAIAAKAMEHIRPGNVIALDSGTTTFELAKLLENIPNLTIITNDLKIATLLEQNENSTVILLGGMLRPKFHCTIGSSVLNALDTLYIDTAFLGTNGLSLRRGLSTPRIETADIKRKMISIAGNVIVLTDSSKVNNEAFASFASLSDINTLITDDAMDAGFVADMKALGVDVQLVMKTE